MKRQILMFVVILLSTAIKAVGVDLSAHRAMDGLPGYVRQIEGEFTPADLDLPDSVFYELSGRAIFIVNKYYLRHNDKFVNELRDSVLPEIKARDLELAAIVLRGAASPEGPYDNNVMLSRNRAKALTRFIAGELNQEFDSLMASSTMAEDYAYLIMMMKEAKDRDYKRVEKMLTPHLGNAKKCKQLLQKADKGKLWRRLLKEYFPALRAARVVLFFRTKYPQIEKFEPEETARFIGLPVNPIMPEPKLDIVRKPRRLERPHMFSISSNLLFDGFYMPNYGWAPSPNIGVEYYPVKGNWTAFAEFTFPYYHRWDKHKFFQVRDYHLEGRYYFNPGKTHKGAFVGGYVNANIYGIGLSKTKGWEGEGAGAAIKGGYVIPLARQGRWRLEISAAVGGYYTRFDPYVYGNPVTGTEDGKYYYEYTGPIDKFKKRNHSLWWFGPTEFTITLRYDLFYYRLTGKGMSTRRYINF